MIMLENCLRKFKVISRNLIKLKSTSKTEVKSLNDISKRSKKKGFKCNYWKQRFKTSLPRTKSKTKLDKRWNMKKNC